jgi:HD superfamily phosphodiesterase
MAAEGGDSEVVVPAVMLHDVGWKRIPEDLQLKAFGPGATAPELNRTHEIEGVKIARSLLRQVSYDRLRVCEILAIIDGHDSRIEALSKNDALVKDADKLWRYTREGFGIDTRRFNETRQQGLSRLRKYLDTWFLTAHGMKSARNLLSQREREKSEDG